MADGREYESGVEPPPVGSAGAMAVPCDATEAMVARAAKNVAAVNDRLVRMHQENAPIGLAFHRALDEGLDALVEMVDTPARSAQACKIKLAMLTQMASWYHDGHPRLLECFTNYVHEVTALLQQTLRHSATVDPSLSGAVNKSSRRFAGIVPNAFFGRRDSGRLS